MYYAYINNSTNIIVKETQLLPLECKCVTNVQNIFRHINALWAMLNPINNNSLDISIIELEPAYCHPEFTMVDINENMWLMNYVIINKIYPLKELSSYIELISLGSGCIDNLFSFACVSNQIELVKYLHQLNIQLTSSTSIYYALIANSNDIMEYIFNNFYDLFDKNIVSITELIRYLTRGNMHGTIIIQKHIKNNNIDISNECLAIQSELEWTCMIGNIKLIFLIIELIPDNISHIIFTDNILKYVCMSGSLEILKYLLDNHNYPQPLMKLALDESLKYCQLIIAKYLIDIGIEVDDYNKYIHQEPSFFFDKNKKKYIDILRFLVEKGVDIVQNNIAFITSAKNKEFDTVEYLIELGADINCEKGLALRSAVFDNNLNAVKMLVSRGCEFIEYSNYILPLCVERNYIEIFNHLLEIGIVDHNNQSLYRAVTLGNIIMVENLMTDDFDINKIIKIAAINDQIEIMQYILKKYSYDFSDYDEMIKLVFDHMSFNAFIKLIHLYPEYNITDELCQITSQLVLGNLSQAKNLIYQYGLGNNIHLLIFVIHINNITMLDFLVELNSSDKYNYWVVISSITNSDILYHVIYNLHINVSDITDAIKYATLIDNTKSHRLLLLNGIKDGQTIISDKMHQYLINIGYKHDYKDNRLSIQDQYIKNNIKYKVYDDLPVFSS
ncbi:ankyrin repeat protein [Megavirus baoshan]|uniref:Ankyrin repeat protein n=1 Tax=Megavirus baoshan TaxID=2496520 RepID=A0A3S8UY77_9VIRU|nr:ankyrin repeat protein [Megavirus baoshan]AZL89765.1 ankyrin repeat protein [Megavirus baoshan]